MSKNISGSRLGRRIEQQSCDDPLPKHIEARLRLLDAAPELYAALKVADRLLYGEGYETSAYSFLARLQIKAALKKARTL